ncbi:DUF2306 domain-containing protein [Leisingera sp. ANG-DT]|uniref:DUF2306 domain-containing protein n=1 Tax=Leisingera sp. ANG-DT TaxID=1577897 RepID=UPI00057F26C6|nr:DUF2306 domain-containing protein [Leisingera sp. ANG-DT]KIC19169.1 hypothetical protein RA21_01235 [Leisingera sp. ANG-DT]
MFRFDTVFLYLLSWPVLRDSFDRLLFLFQPHDGLPLVDQRYADHPLASAVHLIPGIVFFLIGPLQFSPVVRRRFPKAHRALGQVFILSGVISSLGVMHMVMVFPALGGVLTQAVTFAICISLMAAMAFAYRFARLRKFGMHMRLMRLAFALGLTVSTARVYIELANQLLSVPFEQSFTAASAVGLVTNLAVLLVLEARAGVFHKALRF